MSGLDGVTQYAVRISGGRLSILGVHGAVLTDANLFLWELIEVVPQEHDGRIIVHQGIRVRSIGRLDTVDIGTGAGE